MTKHLPPELKRELAQAARVAACVENRQYKISMDQSKLWEDDLDDEAMRELDCLYHDIYDKDW